MVHTLTPMRAIRAKCLDCCCGNSNEVKECGATECPLWHYRLGHRPQGTAIWDDGKADDPKTVEARRESGKRLAACKRGR